MRVLVLTSEPISAERLSAALPGELDPRGVELLVVTPALQSSPIKFWLSDADDAIARAERIERETVERLGRGGVEVQSETGESDPEQAIEDALQTFPADQILVFTHPEEDQRYREDVDVGVLEQRFGVPVKRATVG
jgi:hypothetical protein